MKPAALRKFRSALRQVVLDFCKKQHVCIRCRNERAKRGKAKCAKCAEYERVTAPERMRRRYVRLDRAGLCVHCGQEPQQETNKRCAKCQRAHRETKRRRARQ